MKQTITVFAFLLLANSLLAQAPKWLDYNYRTDNYSDKTYLVGFASEGKITEVGGDYFNILGDVARKKLIESIQVKIQSIATLDVENTNENFESKTIEHFRQQSVSVSQANIVGLKYETYYDKKRKNAYAFCYARKSEVITYYKDIVLTTKKSIAGKIAEAESSVAAGDNPSALKAYYEGMKMLREIDEAQFMLVALGYSKDSDLYIDEVSAYKSQIKNGISQLSNSKNLSLTDVSEFMAYGLKLQTEDISESIFLSKITYQDTGLDSEFSNRFNDIFKQKLVNTSKYNISDKEGKETFITGTYWEEGSKLKMILDIKSKSTGKIIASVEARLPIAWLKEKSISYVPENLKKLKLLDTIELIAIGKKGTAKVGKPLTKPLTVKASNQEEETPMENLPIKFSFVGKDGQEIGKATTTSSGKAKFYFEKFTSDKKIQIIKAEVDVAKWIGVGAESAYYQKIIQDYSIPSAKFIFNVSGLMVYVAVDEKNLGKPMSIPFIEPAIKNALTENGYVFTDDESEADFMIEIKANSRGANEFQGMYFSYVDSNISIIDMESGEEIYKGSFSDIKGVGNNFRQAGIKAYKEAVKKVKKGVLKALIK